MDDNQEQLQDMHRRKRLIYQSWHRGCKETDLILGSYCDNHIMQLDANTLNAYEALLDEDDADIWAWITEKQPIPQAAYEPIIAALRQFRPAA